MSSYISAPHTTVPTYIPASEKSVHYLFNLFALDTKLDLPANTTREDLLKAMDGHVVGKAAWFGRFHAKSQ